MPTTSPLRMQAEIPALVFDVPADTALLTVPRPEPLLANPRNAIAQALLTLPGTLLLTQVVATAFGADVVH